MVVGITGSDVRSTLEEFVNKYSEQGDGIPASISCDMVHCKNLLQIDKDDSGMSVEEVRSVVDCLTAKKPSALVSSLKKRKKCEIVTSLSSSASKRLKTLEQAAMAEKFEAELSMAGSSLVEGLPTGNLDTIGPRVDKMKQVCVTMKQITDAGDVKKNVAADVSKCLGLLQLSVYQKVFPFLLMFSGVAHFLACFLLRLGLL